MADEGRRIPYIIELGVTDEKLRQQMSKWDWESIMGGKGKGFGDVLISDAKDAKESMKKTFSGLNIDWTKILGTKEIGQLEQAVTRALSKSRTELELFAKSGDTKGIEHTIQYVSALGDELKGLGSSFDAESLARGMRAFMKVLMPLTVKFEALANEPKKVEAAFDKLFSGISASAKSVDLGGAFEVSGKIKIAMNGLKATNDEIKEATESLEKYRNVVSKLSGNNPATIKLAQDLDGLNQQLDEQMRKEERLAAQNKTNSAQYAATLKNIMAIENARLKMKAKPTTDMVGTPISQDFDYYEEKINKTIERASNKISELEEKLAHTVDKSFAEVISKQISDIKINLSLSEDSKTSLVNTINQYVAEVNKSPLETIKIQIDDVANVIEDKTKRGYGKNDADDDVNTTKLIAQTEKRFKGVRGAMYRNQNKILQQTKEWRQQMLEQFKFKSGDFEFNFNNNLIEELQTLFDEYGLKINIDPTYLADQIKTVLEGSGVSLSGGTANIDQASMTAAVMAGVRAALLGEQLPTTTMSTSVQERITDATEQTAVDIEQSAKHLDIAEEYVKDIVQKLKDVAGYATKHLGTTKDTKGAIATREFFKAYGINLERVSTTSDDSVIAKMLSEEWEDKDGNKHPSLLTRGDFGKLVGSTVIDELTSFKGSSSNTIPAFVESLREVFYMLQEDTETVDEWTRKKNSREIFDYARGRAKAASSLRDVRSSVRTDKIPDIEYIDKAIVAMSAIGKNTDSLEALRLAREKLGSNTDEQSIQEFNAVANDFYKSTTKVFYDIKKQAEDAFKGTVYLQGSKRGIVKKQNVESYKQLARIGDDDVILDIRVTSSLNNISLGTTKSKHRDRISPYEEKRLLDGKRGDYTVSPEYEKDILRRELEYGGFKPKGIGETPISLDTTIENKRAYASDANNTILELQRKIDELDKGIEARRQELDALQNTIKLVGERPKYKSHLTDEYASQFDVLYDLKKHSLIKNESDLAEGDVPSEISDDISKKKEIENRLRKASNQARLIEEITVEEAQKRLDYISETLVPDEELALYKKFIDNPIDKVQLMLAKSMDGYTGAEFAKIKSMPVDDIKKTLDLGIGQREAISLYSKFIQNPDGVRQGLAESIQQESKDLTSTQKNIDSYILAWVKSEEAKIPEAEERFKRAAENVLSKIGSTMKSLYAEMLATESKINNASSDEEKTILTAHMQDLIQTFYDAQKEYDRLINQSKVSRKRPLGEGRLKNVAEWQTVYKESVRDRLSYDKHRIEDDIYSLQGSKSSLSKKMANEISGRDNAEGLARRAETTKRYNELLEQSLILTGSIKKMEEDGSPEKEIQKKREELEYLNGELDKILEQSKLLGGLISQKDAKEYSAEERKAYALEQIKAIDSDLITARAQKNVVASRIAKKDREIAEVDRWGLGAGIGARTLNQEKYKAISEFMNGDYVFSLMEEEREKTKSKIQKEIEKSKVAETKMAEVFDDKVSTAMIRDGLNPYDKKQTNKFLQTERGIQYANEHNSAIESIRSNLEEYTRTQWSLYDEKSKEIREQVLSELKDSMKVDNGVLSYASKIKDESGEWVNELVQVYVRDALRQRLSDAKEILEEEQAPIQANIDRLYADRKTAIEYGGVGEKEILSADIIEDQIRRETELNKKKEIRAELQQKISELERAGIADSDDSIKQERKKLAETENQIAQLEMLVRNRQKLVELRWDESKADSYTDEEKELRFTDQIVNYNQKIEASLAKQEELKRKIEGASEEEKTNLQYQLSKEEEKVSQWRKSIAGYEGRLQQVKTVHSEIASTKTAETSGGLIGALKEAIGGADVNLTPVTEILQQILEILNKFSSEGIKGVGAKASSEERSKHPKKTEAELIRDNALKQNDVVKGLAAGRGSLYNQYMKDVEDLNKAVEEANAASEKDKKKAIAKVKTKAQKVSTLSYNILKNTSQWDYLVANSDSGAKNLYLKQGESLREKMEKTALKEHGILGKRGGKLKNPKYQYDFLGFDGDTLTYQLTDIEGKTRKVTMVWNEFNKQVAITSDKTGYKLSELAGKVESFGEKFKNAIDAGYLADNDADLERFKKKVEEIKTAIVDGASFDKINGLRNEALRIADEVNKKVNKVKRSYTGTTEMNAVERQHSNIENRGILENDDLAKVTDYNKAYSDLIAKHREFSTAGTLYDPENQKTLQKMALNVKALGKELETAQTKSEDLQQKVANSGVYNGKAIGDMSQVAHGTDLYEQMRAKLEELGATNIKIDMIHHRATGTIRHNNRVVSDLEVAYDELTNSLARYHRQERESLTGVPAFLNGFQKKFNSIMQYLSMTMSIHRVISEVRKGIQYIREIDKALTELKKVTDETEETYRKFLDTASKTAAKVGSTIKDVVSSTADWARLGYSMEQAAKFAETTQILMNVSEFTDVSQATDTLISAVQAFGYTAETSMDVVDLLNTIGK